MENEVRLIDANASICKKCDHYLVCMHYSPERAKCTQFKDSTKCVEVVHGRWIASGCGFDCCSECRKVYADGYLTAMGIKPRTQFNYCPNCGAKMDGERKDNEN